MPNSPRSRYINDKYKLEIFNIKYKTIIPCEVIGVGVNKYFGEEGWRGICLPTSGVAAWVVVWSQVGMVLANKLGHQVIHLAHEDDVAMVTCKQRHRLKL